MKCWATLAPLPFVFLAALGFLAIIDPTRHNVFPPAFMGLLAGFLVLFGWIAAAGFGAQSRASSIRRDLLLGSAKQFAAREDATESSPPDAQSCLESNMEPGPREFEVLGSSGRLWTIDGARAAGWKLKKTSRVAETPEFAAMAAQRLQPVADEDGRHVESGQRELSATEREEVRSYARYTWRRPLWPAVFLSLWFVPLAVYTVIERKLPEGMWNRFNFFWLGAFTISTNAFLFRSILRSLALARDARIGRVIIGRISPHDGSAAAGATVDFEMLPTSKLMWTNAQRPADWRTHGA